MIAISKNKGPRGPQRTKGAGKKDSAKANFSVSDASESAFATATATLAESASTSALAALISLQSDGGGNARGRLAAERTLDLLERVRNGLLTGQISDADLQGLVHVASAKTDVDDPALAELYDDIALRARVELAKLGR